LLARDLNGNGKIDDVTSWSRGRAYNIAKREAANDNAAFDAQGRRAA
jgi:hypothetical protein